MHLSQNNHPLHFFAFKRGEDNWGKSAATFNNFDSKVSPAADSNFKIPRPFLKHLLTSPGPGSDKTFFCPESVFFLELCRRSHIWVEVPVNGKNVVKYISSNLYYFNFQPFLFTIDIYISCILSLYFSFIICISCIFNFFSAALL